MAIAPIPPWESINPMDFVNAAASGARLGLERAGQTQSGLEFGDQMALNWARLNSENARAGAELGAQERRASAADALRRMELQTSLNQWMQEMGTRKQAADELTRYRAGELASKNFRDALAFTKATQPPTAKPDPLVKTLTLPGGQKVNYVFSPGTGTFSVVHPNQFSDTQSGLTPRQIAQENLKELHREQSALSKKWASADLKLRRAQANPNGPEAQEYAKDQARLAEINQQIKGILTPQTPAAGGGAADALSAPPELPLEAPTQMREGTNVDPNDPLGILGSPSAAPAAATPNQ